MDPNANLSQQLEVAMRILYDIETDPQDAERLADLVMDLHEWLLKGGAKPALWS